MKKLTSSFGTGAIALVFAVLGYQTALLVHHSATARIIANRDEPDTVYVFEGNGGNCSSGRQSSERHNDGEVITRSRQTTGRHDAGETIARSRKYAERHDARHISERHNAGQTTERHNAWHTSERNNAGRTTELHYARHSPKAQQVRRKAAPRHVENFRFDPNTCSQEDFMRLGFSPKQAASIINYRAKGGRFRRKIDFAKSYVVSDSIYARLEPYIVIPKIDLNLADSAAFDLLPGIGGWYAKKMVEYRSRLGGYSYLEQLMDIKGIDEEKFESFSDLICISAPYRYPLWSLPADSLARHPYIKSKERARSIVFYRDHNSREKWTVEDLRRAGILDAESAGKLLPAVDRP